MECRIRQVNGNWHAAFKHGGTEYTHSLRTKSEHEAEVRLGVIRDTLFRIENGTMTVPPQADPKQFIISGGQLTGKPTVTPRLTVGQLADLYLDSLQGIEDNTRLTLKIHLNHAKRLLKADTAIDTMTLADADRYARTRMKESHRGKLTQAYTARKELRTFHRAWTWAKAHGRTHSLPAWVVDDVHLPKDRGRESFKNYKQITTILARGGVSDIEEERLWETLYLDDQELQELLAHG